MSETARIADQLRRAFDGNAWHGDSLFEILEGVTAAQGTARPVPSAHSIRELVLHIAAWDDAVRRRMTGVAVSLSAEENFPRVPNTNADTSAAAWKKTLADARRVHEELIDAVKNFPEASLNLQVPGKTGAYYDFYYMLHGVVQHELYHAGQIALLKKM